MITDEQIAASFGFNPTGYSRQFIGALEAALRDRWSEDASGSDDRLVLTKDKRYKKSNVEQAESIRRGMAKIFERRDNRRAIVAQLHKDGLGFREIVAQTKSAESTIREDMRAIGVKVTLQADKTARAEERRKVVGRLKAEGFSGPEIAAKLGIAIHLVNEHSRARATNDAR